MILSGCKIKEELELGNITIDKFDENMLNPNSYNYRIGNVLYKISDDIIDPNQKTKYEEIIIPEEGYILEPNQLYLANTFERIGSSKYVIQLIGRSSLGRLGLFLQITAPIGHVGCYGNWTLELKCVQKIRIYPYMKIGQVSFWILDGKKEQDYSNGYYNNVNKPLVSGFYNKEN